MQLLAAVPELRPHLPALATGHGPVWAALAAAWPELEAIYQEELACGEAPKLYQRLLALRTAAGKTTEGEA